MTALWLVEVEEKEGKKLVLSVRPVNPDAGEFPTTATFGLRLLYDQVWKSKEKKEEGEKWPLAEAVSWENTEDSRWMEKNAERYIEKLEQTGGSGERYNEEATKESIEKKLEGKGVTKKNKTAWENAWLEEWSEYWEEPSNHPAAKYTIQVTEERWLAHLKTGQRWRSAAY